MARRRKWLRTGQKGVDRDPPEAHAELRPRCHALGVLTGKYHGEGKAAEGRMLNEGMKEFLPEEQRTARIISAVKSVSEQAGRSMAQVALAWLRYQTVPVVPII